MLRRCSLAVNRHVYSVSGAHDLSALMEPASRLPRQEYARSSAFRAANIVRCLIQGNRRAIVAPLSLKTGDEHGNSWGAATRWRPGTSGHPGGRQKTIRDVVELARQLMPETIRTLATVMKTSKSDTAKVAAAQVILDRGWGKPMQGIKLAQEDRDAPPRWPCHNHP